MKYYFEWSAQKDISVVPGNYFESMALLGDTLYPDTGGRDEFQLAGLIMLGKRFAASGRNKSYSSKDVSANQAIIEAAPPSWVSFTNDTAEIAFTIDTDIFLDPGLLASCLRLDITKESETAIHIPLNRSDVRIDWPSRGTFVVTLPIQA